VRLLHAGLRRKDGSFATGVIHLWHAEADRGRLADNEARLAQIVAGDGVRARTGLTAMVESAATRAAS